MPLLAELASRLDQGPGSRALEKAREAVARILLPERITGPLIQKYIRKAILNHTWHALPPETRALMLLARRLPRIKSPTLASILKQAFLRIELATTRGQALLYGALIAMKKAAQDLHRLLHNASKLLILGLSYLNNPPIYRIYG
ncbi:hypothetical protein CF15_08265 [Pyrodictium occultum]|uniref:Uncharacterized protein n=1 Tax=Pyrodictium occultum TaxID=2309 RepID=A0A0V8RS42_PYROC|nr:hypothetical protein [Pyrodictium occultum]KSW10765.1 hypothetical protein CF15_08265 [Pyrodictium occultum]